MSTYKGLKSADAEIVLDFTKNQATFDYSLNKFQESVDSNHSCTLTKEGKPLNRGIVFLQDFFVSIWFIVLVIGTIGLGLLQIFFIKIPKYQYTWQKILKAWTVFRYGTQEETIIGKQEAHILKFNLLNNIWFEYNLDGDYKEKIKKISLLRRFVKKQYWGITSHQQEGWNLVFEFSSPPQYGNLSVKSLLWH